jgi:DNA processing protein
MKIDHIEYWIALKSIPGIGNAAFPVLLDRFGSLEAVFSASADKLSATPGLSKKCVLSITCFSQWDNILRQVETLDKSGITVITYLDDFYPAKLAEIYDSPALLYVQGNLLPDEINMAVVGSRAASTYGKYTTERISRELALRGITVVSGMARGIDSAAHRGALSAHGRTIAVMGSGLDVIYPPENKKLFQTISQNGAVISEYPLGTKPLAFNFPSRNRIISGMSYGVVVVEAGEKSGSLITARLAAEQGREVFAVPGSIDSANSRGVNSLIKQGAKLIENIDDILDDILPQLDIAPVRQSSYKGPDLAAAVSTTASAGAVTTSDENETEKTIINVISHGMMHADDIIQASGLSSADTLSALITLELKGVIQQHPGKLFSLKNLQV